VIGTGPAGQKAAIAAAKARKIVATIDRAAMLGGVSVPTGTIPSKTVPEAIFQLAGPAVKALYGGEVRNHVISVQHVSSRVSTIVERETEIVRAQLTPNGLAIYQGSALFLDPHTVEVQIRAQVVPKQTNSTPATLSPMARNCNPTEPKPKRTISAAGRKRIAAAQRARWAKVKSAG
jgi:pyruvate/2-oxoglutarate dehydrogenase complex dihydrolipoamide dehydrogenase (E3) component